MTTPPPSSRTSWHNSPKGRRRIQVLILSGVAALGIALLARSLMSRETEPAKAHSAASLSVTAAVPREAQWPRTLSASGLIAPWQEAVIGAQTSGLSIARLDVTVGDVVRRGQLLARFDTATLRAEEAQLQAALAQARGVAAQADTNRARALELQGSGGISEQEVQRYVTEAVTAEAQLAAARAQLKAKRLQLRQADVVAPDDGIISARAATLGAVAGNGQELFRLVRQGRLEWRGEFTATQIANIDLGQEATLQFPDGQHAKARVRHIAPLLDTRSRLGLVYADIDPSSPARGGMYVEGQVALAPSAAQVLPAASVVVRDGRSIVFHLQDAGTESKVQARPVTVGRRQGTEVEILDTLDWGKRVVAAGAGLLTDGDTVRIEPGPGGAQAAASSGGQR